MDINTFYRESLEALGDNTGASNVNEWRRKFVTALTGLVADAYTDADAEAAIANKTEIAALTSGSTAAEIVAALQA